MTSGGTVGRPPAARRPTGRLATRERADDRDARAPSAGELAWLALVPCAVLVVAAIVVLGPPLGDVLFPRHVLTFIPALAELAPPRPEPTEQARFLLSLLGPLLLSGCVVLGIRRARPLRSATLTRLVTATQMLALAFVVTCVLVQHWYSFHIGELTGHVVYFTLATLVAAGAIAAALGAGLASEHATRAVRALGRDSRARVLAGTAVAAAATALWLLPAINFDDTIGNAHEAIATHIVFWLDEVFAVLDGRPPLVDFAAQYGSLWPYPVAGAMALLGSSIGVFTVAMATISAAAMLALFALLRRVVRGTLTALALFLPLLATSFFVMEGPLANRYAISNLFGTFPLRYAGPLLVVWLVARHLDGAAPRRPWWLFLAAGLALLNNGDFGIPAFGATIAAVLWTSGRPTAGRLGRLAVAAAAGLAGAFALVSVLTLAVAGAWPQLGLLLRFERLFALAGWGMVPMTPVIGISTIVYLTYVAAIGVATVRAVAGEPDRLMTGLLAWSGVFGLGVGSYYMGRSHPEVLTNMFTAWALSVTLLLVLAVRSVVARPARRPTLAEAACLFAFGVLVCSLPQAPRPWSEVARLRDTGESLYAPPIGQRFVAAHTRPGEVVAILSPLGHRTAYDLGLVDVTPNTGGGAFVTFEQLDEALARLRAAGGRKVFLAHVQAWPELLAALASRGYVDAGRERQLLELADGG